MANDARVIFLMGPTASGKTDAACALADRYPVDIISVDSALVYRGLDIGTAKPPPAILAKYPHALIDICDPVERYSAARFRTDALGAIEAIHARGRIALLVGGTGLYFRVLLDGIAKLPDSDPAIRAQLNRELETCGLQGMHDRLAQVDPDSARRIHPNDPQRTLRALEVHRLTGRAMSTLLSRESVPGMPWQPLQIVWAPADRAWLHARIARRFDDMLRAGFINEVRGLKNRGDLSLEHPALRAVGYRAAWHYLEGETDFRTMIERGITATRQLAKRQLTWFRGVAGAAWFDPVAPDAGTRLSVAVKRHIEVN